MLGRATTSIDMNRFQICYGIDAVQESQVPRGECFLGDITDLRRLVPFANQEADVFNPSKEYAQTKSMEDNSQDVIVASLVLDLLNSSGRDSFLREANRVLGNGKYLVLVLPNKKVDEQCRAPLLRDIEEYGFTTIPYFTGTYQGRLQQEDDEKTEQVEAYVIVAQKVSLNLPSEQAQLRLKPSTYVADETSGVSLGGRGGRKKEGALKADYFVKVESRLDLRDVKTAPPQELPSVDYKQGIEAVVQGANPEDIKQVLGELRTILGGQYGK
jgi:SAM-dependent methyltransferase